MLRHPEDEMKLLLNSLVAMGNLNSRETRVGMLCYNIGRISREQEIVNNRKLFEEFDEDEKRGKSK